MRASELLQRAIKHNAQGRHEAVIRPLELLLEKRPHHPRVLWEYAQALEGTGERDAAIRSLDALHRVAPEARKPWRLHARLLNNPGEQIDLLNRALQHHPTDATLLSLHKQARERLAEQSVDDDAQSAAQHTELLYDYAIPSHDPTPAPSEGKDPDDDLARELASEIRAMQDVVDPEYRPVESKIFSWAARRHVRRSAQALKPHGFEVLGDFTPRHLEGSLGGAVLMRFLLAKDRTSYATCYYLPSQAGSLLQRFWSWLRRRPDGLSVVELQSELASTNFVITNNTGEVDLFDYGPRVQRQSLPPASSLHQLVATHQTASLQKLREGAGTQLRAFEDLVDIVASESRLQATRAQYRRQIGLATDDELQRILGKKYVRYGARVRRHLSKMAAVAE